MSLSSRSTVVFLVIGAATAALLSGCQSTAPQSKAEACSAVAAALKPVTEGLARDSSDTSNPAKVADALHKLADAYDNVSPKVTNSTVRKVLQDNVSAANKTAEEYQKVAEGSLDASSTQLADAISDQRDASDHFDKVCG